MAKKQKPSMVGKVLKVTGALVAAGILGGALGIGGFSLMNPAPEPVIEYVETTIEVPFETIVEVPVETIVEVENKDMAIISEYMEDILDMDEPVAEIVALYAARDLALEVLESDDFADMLEDEGIIRDEDDFDLVKVYAEDLSDIEIKSADYDDEEYKFVIKAKVEDEDKDVKLKVFATIKVEDGEAELTKVVEE